MTFSRPPLVELVVPCLNEAHVIERSVETIREFLQRTRFPYRWRIVVADNGSKDGTADVARKLVERYPDEVGLIALDVRGRGRALREAWSRSQADIMAYTDVDLSTELEALEKLCRAIHEQGYDLGTGSRLLPESQVERGAKRELISRSYNLLVKLVLGTHFSDAQCGFKAVSRRVAHELIPQIKDQSWFFDTELLVLAEKQGYRIKDQPVRWIDDDDSRVKIVKTAWDDVKGVLRLRRHLWSREFRAARARATAQRRTLPAVPG
jgi:glycosyltransferase involved in cell wall biosynthesis